MSCGVDECLLRFIERCPGRLGSVFPRKYDISFEILELYLLSFSHMSCERIIILDLFSNLAFIAGFVKRNAVEV